MKSWVKLYTESNHDPKIGTLTWAQRGMWAALLALAGELDYRDEDDNETGELDALDAVAWHIRVTPAEMREAVDAFTERGMVDEREGVLFVTNFGKRQRRAPSDSHERVSERVKRHRNEHVTSLKRDVTSSESDTESDTDSDPEIAAPATPCAPTPEAVDLPFSDPPEPEAEPEPVAAAPPHRKRATLAPRADPRTDHAAIRAVRTVTKRNPPKDLYDRIIGELGDDPDVPLLETCFSQWRALDFRPNNYQGWLFEWYHNGGPPEHYVKGNGSGKAVETIPGPEYWQGIYDKQQRTGSVL